MYIYGVSNFYFACFSSPLLAKKFHNLPITFNCHTFQIDCSIFDCYKAIVAIPMGINDCILCHNSSSGYSSENQMSTHNQKCLLMFVI